MADTIIPIDAKTLQETKTTVRLIKKDDLISQQEILVDQMARLQKQLDQIKSQLLLLP